jgi:hypothetical protein
MRVYAICRNCAEVHPAELECPACVAGLLPALPARPVVRSRRAAGDDALPGSFASDGSLARRGVRRATAFVVSAYLVAVVVLLLAVFAQA